ncbi:hypothetical protein MES5069_180127 [Mesorhizobium escarrei]|uniref:Transposase n=1 Tax=Mesorhizobium escarrei TaxID=666018 RepID=A0ABN8JIC3_9HYPH|nr:hypothetical protein MES5069_180127 [Mesorhizobium escarrei]
MWGDSAAGACYRFRENGNTPLRAAWTRAENYLSAVRPSFPTSNARTAATRVKTAPAVLAGMVHLSMRTLQIFKNM